MNVRCITNNPLIIKKGLINIETVDGDTLSVLLVVKDYILKGHRLISHPLTSSIRPDVSPYKTILLSLSAEKIDAESLNIINHAIEYTENLMSSHVNPINWDEKSLEDFQFIDMDIIQNFIQ